MEEIAGVELVTEDLTTELMYVEIPANLVYSIPIWNLGNFFLFARPYAGFGIHAKQAIGNNSESRSFGDAEIKNLGAGLNFLWGYKFSNGFLISRGYGLRITNIAKDSEGSSIKNQVELAINFKKSTVKGGTPLSGKLRFLSGINESKG